MRCAIVLARASLSSTLSVGNWISSATTRRTMLYDLIIGAAEGVVADNPFVWELTRCTTAGTAGSAATVSPLDLASGSPLTTAGQAHTTDPTLTAVNFSIGLNQRASYRFLPQPGGELWTPATANAGYALRTPTSSAVAGRGLIYIQEE